MDATSQTQDAIDAWVENNWERIVADIASLVAIESTEDLPKACDGAPFGPGPRRSLSKAIEIASGMGFETADVDGFMGYADLAGAPGAHAQLGIIGHTDVVPAGPGWNFPPFELTRKEGYLIGRGVIDDKGPLVCALHALRYWAEQDEPLAANVRVLFGADEECGMKDVPYYRDRFTDPDFLFTPDAEFPVSYGEKGILHGTITSTPCDESLLVEIEGGTVDNAVPGLAHAVVCIDEGRASAIMGQCGQKNTDEQGIHLCIVPADTVNHDAPAGKAFLRIDAVGKCAHASTPDLGVNAIALLVDFLHENNLIVAGERAFFDTARLLLGCTDGSGWGLACSDEHFGTLTLVGSVVKFTEGRIALTFDCRYPTTLTSSAIRDRVENIAASSRATVMVSHAAEPFLVDPHSPEIEALMDIYNNVTGEDAKPFTMAGGTYAREFSRGVSFGAEKPWEEIPAWAGGMHAPDEAVSESLLKQATAIYIRAIKRLTDILA